jgi:hypothetical protein
VLQPGRQTSAPLHRGRRVSASPQGRKGEDHAEASHPVAWFAVWLGSASPWPPSARAQEPLKTWQWSITPYVWAAGTKGRVGARDVVGSVDVTTGDVLQTGDVAFMAALEGGRGRWLGHLDAFYVSTTDDEDLAPVLGSRRPSTSSSTRPCSRRKSAIPCSPGRRPRCTRWRGCVTGM